MPWFKTKGRAINCIYRNNQLAECSVSGRRCWPGDNKCSIYKKKGWEERIDEHRDAS